VTRSKGTGGKKRKSGGSKGRYRSAVTGRYVTKSYAKRHPKTTIRESRAGKFADHFIERHPDTFHELSKR
jgi:hypothetical protein